MQGLSLISSQRHPINNLERCSDDLKSLIFDFLPFREQKNVAQTCKTLQGDLHSLRFKYGHVRALISSSFRDPIRINPSIRLIDNLLQTVRSLGNILIFMNGDDRKIIHFLEKGTGEVTSFNLDTRTKQITDPSITQGEQELSDAAVVSNSRFITLSTVGTCVLWEISERIVKYIHHFQFLHPDFILNDGITSFMFHGARNNLILIARDLHTTAHAKINITQDQLSYSSAEIPRLILLRYAEEWNSREFLVYKRSDDISHYTLTAYELNEDANGHRAKKWEYHSSNTGFELLRSGVACIEDINEEWVVIRENRDVVGTDRFSYHVLDVRGGRKIVTFYSKRNLIDIRYTRDRRTSLLRGDYFMLPLKTGLRIFHIPSKSHLLDIPLSDRILDVEIKRDCIEVVASNGPYVQILRYPFNQEIIPSPSRRPQSVLRNRSSMIIENVIEFLDIKIRRIYNAIFRCINYCTTILNSLRLDAINLYREAPLSHFVIATLSGTMQICTLCLIAIRTTSNAISLMREMRIDYQPRAFL